MNRVIKSQHYLMKCLGFIMLFGFISLGAIGGCNNNNGNNGNNGNDGGQFVSALFVLIAESGTITPLEGSSDGEFEITLEGVTPSMTFFSDRPERAAGTVELQEGLDLIGFAEVPPNATLVAHETIGTAEQPVFELTDPVYDAPSGVVGFRGLLLDPQANVPEGDLSDLALFIDELPIKICTIGGWMRVYNVTIDPDCHCCVVNPALECPCVENPDLVCADPQCPSGCPPC